MNYLRLNTKKTLKPFAKLIKGNNQLIMITATTIVVFLIIKAHKIV